MTKALNPKVVKSNELIKASYSMDLVEHRLIGLAIYTARESNKGLRKFEHLVIKPNTYAKIFNVSLSSLMTTDLSNPSAQKEEEESK